MAAGGRALLRASMLLCPLRPGSASREPRGHGRAGPSAALRPGGNATSSSVAAASNPGSCPRRPLPAPSPPPAPTPPPPPRLLLSPRLPPPAAPRGRSALPDLPRPPAPGRTPVSASAQELWGPRGRMVTPAERAEESSSPNSSLGGHSPTRFPPPWPPSRQSHPVRPWGPRIAPEEPGPWPGVREKGRAEFPRRKGRRGKLSQTNTPERDRLPTSLPGRDFKPSLATP